MHKSKYVTHLDNVQGIRSEELADLKKVMKEFAFRANEYYLSLIDWNNPDDPIRRLIIPHTDELDHWGRLDASCEGDYTKVPGLQHKYRSTALLLTTNICGGFCRYCFRKRLFLSENAETIRDFTPDLDYIREHPEINNVLLTGGDPLMLSTARLRSLIEKLREIDHVKIIRIGSKLPAFNPYRIADDPDLLAMIRQFSTPEKRIYIMAHFTHPHELTDIAIAALDSLRKANAEIVNQCPIIHGVNDSPETLAQLFNQLSYLGVPPYYVFQCRPTLGNKTYSVPIEQAYDIFEQARMKCSGLAKRARFVMSHTTGKIEIIGRTEQQIFFKYHRAANPADSAKVMVFRRNPKAYWFDDYDQLVTSAYQENPFEPCEPESVSQAG